MTAVGSANSVRRPSWWTKLLRSFGLATGAVAVATSAAPAQDAGYRSAATAPASWQAFAQELQGRFEQELSADDAEAERVRAAVATHDEKSPETLVVRVWVSRIGQIDRLEFAGLDLDDPSVAVYLRARLASIMVSPPPSDMLQPLHLRLSLRAKDESGKDR